jgi:hypothetical protein
MHDTAIHPISMTDNPDVEPHDIGEGLVQRNGYAGCDLHVQ